MRLPRVQITLRGMMVAVAVVALVVAGVQMKYRRDRYLASAIRYAQEAKYETEQEGHQQGLAQRCRGIWRTQTNRESLKAWWGQMLRHQREAEENAQRAATYLRMSAKYEDAARFPWLSVESDLPEPE